MAHPSGRENQFCYWAEAIIAHDMKIAQKGGNRTSSKRIAKTKSENESRTSQLAANYLRKAKVQKRKKNIEESQLAVNRRRAN